MPADDEIPEATGNPSGDDQPPVPNMPELELGEPFAIAHDCQLLKAQVITVQGVQAQVPGCFASVQCHACKSVFKIDLLSEQDEYGCPGCELTYTACLLVCLSDDTEIVEHFMGEVLHANGIDAPPQLAGDNDREPPDDGEPG